MIAPIATLKFKSLLWDITQAKPSLELREGVFYNGIETYSIRIGTKDKNSNKLGDVLIYQHEKTNPGNYRVIRAKSGEMVKSANDRAMTLILYDGVSYEEAGRENDKDHPLIQSKFQSDIIRIDLSGFDMQRTDEDLWKNHMKMMSMNQLTTSIDSLQSQSNQRSTEVEDYFANSITTPLTSDSGHMASTDELIFEKIDPKYQRNTLNVALNVTRNNKNFLERTIAEMDNRREYINKHKIEWHRKLTLSFACIILFFIGAPLGAIIKKGGLGLPVVFSVVFFLIFHITSISGEKMVDSGVLSPFGGMWLSSMILLPIAVFLTYKAAKDAPIFDGDTYTKLFDRIKSRFNKSQSVAA